MLSKKIYVIKYWKTLGVIAVEAELSDCDSIAQYYWYGKLKRCKESEYTLDYDVALIKVRKLIAKALKKAELELEHIQKLALEFAEQSEATQL